MATAVLLISDHPAMTRACAEAVQPNPLIHETSVAAGFARAQRAAPDLVLLDLGLPERPLELIPRLRAKGLPVIVLGDAHDPAAAAQALDAGAAQFLARPLDARLVRAAVGRVLATTPAEQGGALTLADAERRQIARALEAHHGNRTHAARALGVARATLIKKIKVYGLDA
jgi:DNA-binding NtrC family response regulator